MKEVSGPLASIGSATVISTGIGKTFIKFDTIEIGDHILQNVRTARTLGDFLERGLGSNVTVYLSGKLLIAVKLPNGKLYFWKRNAFALAIFVLFYAGIAVNLFFMAGHSFVLLGVSILFFYLMLGKEFKHAFLYQPRFSGHGGVPLKS